MLDILFLQTKNLQEVAKKINTRREFVNSILEPIGIALILYLLYFRTEVRGYPVEESIALIFLFTEFTDLEAKPNHIGTIFIQQ